MSELYPYDAKGKLEIRRSPTFVLTLGLIDPSEVMV